MSLYNRYRPQTFDEMVGNKATVSALNQMVVAEDSPHAILIHGPTGCGKTTLGRIVLRELGCQGQDFREVDSADFRGIDTIREIRKQSRFLPLEGKVRGWLLDECFHGSTSITTDKGDIPIMEVRVGERVRNLRGWGDVEEVFVNRVALDRLVRVKVGDQYLVCSGNHRFFTTAGWCLAKDLAVGDLFLRSDHDIMASLAYSGGANNEAVRMVSMSNEDYEQVLWAKLRGEVVESGSKTNLAEKCVWILWQGFSGAETLIEVLFDRLLLFGSLWSHSVGTYPLTYQRTAEGLSCYGGREEGGQTILRTHEEDERIPRDTEACGTNQTFEGNFTQVDGDSGWQWNAYERATQSLGKTTRRLGAGIRRVFGVQEKGLSHLLQTGHREPGFKARNRSRWEGSQEPQNSGKGQEKGLSAGFARVEGIESYERTSEQRFWRDFVSDHCRDRGYVEFYDLQVSNHPSYFAGGVAVHNCHKLSNDAQHALLKVLEDSPAHVYWVLCTTDPRKLLPTVRGRCSQFEVEKLSGSVLVRLLYHVAKEEGEKLPRDILGQVAESSGGHVRDALQLLEKVLSVDPDQREEAARQIVEAEAEVIELCRCLLDRGSWKKITRILGELKGHKEPESVRRAVLGYCSAVLMKGSNQPAAQIMESFLDPFYDSGFPGLVFACYSSIQVRVVDDGDDDIPF